MPYPMHYHKCPGCGKEFRVYEIYSLIPELLPTDKAWIEDMKRKYPNNPYSPPEKREGIDPYKEE